MMPTDDFTPWPAALKETYVRAGYWLGMPLTDILRRQCAATPHKVALIAGDEHLTYAELDDAAQRLAVLLLERGLRPGDRALVQLPNGAALYITYWALLKIGVRAVFALFSHNAHELTSFHEQLEPKLLILSRRHKLFARGAPIAAPVVLFVEEEEVFRESSAPPPLDPTVTARVRAEDVAFFQLSGGSTSTPKLIPRTHDDYYYSVRRSAEICALDEHSVYLCALPAPHNFPMSSPGALGTWYAGGTVVFADDPSPATCFPLIERHGVTMTSLVPPLAALWLEAAPAKRAALASLQLLQIGGAKLPESVARRIEPELGCRLQQVFGMAEGLVCYTHLEDDDWHRHNTQGRPMSEADEVRIVDEEGQPVADGQPGRLLTRGPYTVRGYYRAREHNRRVFDEDGFYQAGDLVQRTPSGHLVVVGREKDQVNRGGEKIAAEEVENHLLTHPDILQAAVVAVPDETLGERCCAFLVCRGEMPKPHLLRRHLRARGIADYKLPDRFVAIDALPLTPVGKPDKVSLRHRATLAEKETDLGNS